MSFMKSLRRAPAFRPTRRIDVYDRQTERAGGEAVKVAEAETDGVQGRLKLLDPGFADVLEPLFHKKQRAFSGGGLADGTFADGAPEVLTPWRPQTVDHVIGHELKLHDLRAEIVKLS